MAHLRQCSRTPETVFSKRAPGTGDVIRCTTCLGRVHTPSTWSPELLGPGKSTNEGQPSLRLCGAPQNLNLSRLDLGSARKPWPTLVPLQSYLEPEQYRLGKHTRCERGKPSVAQTL